MLRRKRGHQQGALDGACGFYAITNALQLLEPELSAEEIFRAAWQGFLRDGNPLALIDGTTRVMLRNSLRRTIDSLHECYEFFEGKEDSPYRLDFSMPYWLHDTPRDRQRVIEHLMQADARNGCVVIMGYRYRQASEEQEDYHWTVIRGCKDEHLITCDSGGEKPRISLDQVRIDSTQAFHALRPYNIESEMIFVLRRVRP